MASRPSPALRTLRKQIVEVRNTLRRKFDASGSAGARRKLLSDFHKLAKANAMLGLAKIPNFEIRGPGTYAKARPWAGKKAKVAGKVAGKA